MIEHQVVYGRCSALAGNADSCTISGRIERRSHSWTSTLAMRIYMQTKYSPEQPIRFYHLHLQPDLLGGWTLLRETGVQGSRGRITREYFEQREAAEEKLIQRRDSQLDRGYRVVFREGTAQGAD